MDLLCKRKTCKHNEWNLFYGKFCNRSVATIGPSGKCEDFTKMTTEEQKSKRDKYGYNNLY